MYCRSGVEWKFAVFSALEIKGDWKHFMSYFEKLHDVLPDVAVGINFIRR